MSVLGASISGCNIWGVMKSWLGFRMDDNCAEQARIWPADFRVTALVSVSDWELPVLGAHAIEAGCPARGLQATCGPGWPWMRPNTKSSIYLKPFFCSPVFVSVCVFNVRPKTTLLLPVWPRDATRLDTPEGVLPHSPAGAAGCVRQLSAPSASSGALGHALAWRPSDCSVSRSLTLCNIWSQKWNTLQSRIALRKELDGILDQCSKYPWIESPQSLAFLSAWRQADPIQEPWVCLLGIEVFYGCLGAPA